MLGSIQFFHRLIRRSDGRFSRQLSSRFTGRTLVAGATVFALSSLVLTGCGFFLGTKSRNQEIEFRQNTEECLSELKENMASWAKTGQPGMGTQIDCIVRGIDQFSTQTRGRSGEGWSKGELSGFFDTYFPAKDGTPSSLWIEEILKLKQSWFGGYSDRLTTAELARMRAFLLKVKPDLEIISPHAPELFFKRQVHPDGPNAERSKDVADLIANKLTRLSEIIVAEIELTTEAGRPAYDVESFLNLLLRLGALKEKTDRLRNLTEGFKNLLNGGPSRFVVSNEWPRVLRSTAKAWGLSVRFKYGLLYAASDFEAAAPFARDAVDLLGEAVEAQDPRQGGIPADRLAVLAEALADPETGVIEIQANEKTVGIRPATIRNLLPKLLGKVLYGNSKTDQDKFSKSLNALHIARLRDIVEDWIAGQQALATAFGKSDRLALPTLIAQLNNTNPSGAQIRSLLSAGRPITKNDRSQPIVAARSEAVDMSRSAATFYNSVRLVVSALFDGYTHSIMQNVGELTQNEVAEIYWDARDFGIDFNVTDARNRVAGGRTFLEASIFTSVARGAATVNIAEVVEWFHLAISSSFLGDRIYSTLAGTCSVPAIDVFGQKKLDTKCFREHFWSNMAEYLPNLPNLTRWYENSSANTQERFRIALEEAGRPRGYDDRYATDSSELRAMVPVLHYTESLILNHDQNGDGYLDTDEVWKAFPTFEYLIGTMKPIAKDHVEVRKAAYSFLLTFGKPPDSSGRMAGVLGWGIYRLATDGNWSRFLARHAYFPGAETADRATIVEVIASFNVMGRGKKEHVLQKFLEKNYETWRQELTSDPKGFSPKLAYAFGCYDEKDESLGTQFATAVLQLTDEETRNQTVFVERVKQLIVDDPRFDLRCEPF